MKRMMIRSGSIESSSMRCLSSGSAINLIAFLAFLFTGLWASAQTATYVYDSSQGFAGSSILGTQSSTQVKVTFTFKSGGTINAPAVLTAGAADLDFKSDSKSTCKAGSVTSSTQCTVIVDFNPTAPGMRLGAVQIYSGKTVISTVPVYGIGESPLAQFPLTGTLSSIGSGLGASVVAVDGSGNLYLTNYYTETGNGDIDKIPFNAGSYGAPVTVAGNILENNCNGLIIDAAGDILFSDTAHQMVKKIVAVNGVVDLSSSIVQVGPLFDEPNGLALDGLGNLFVSSSPAEVDEVTYSNGGYASSKTPICPSKWGVPTNIAIDEAGTLYVTDSKNSSTNNDNSGEVLKVTKTNGVYNSTPTVIYKGRRIQQRSATGWLDCNCFQKT